MADKFPEQEITPIPVSSFPVIIGNVISPVSELCDSDWERKETYVLPWAPRKLYSDLGAETHDICIFLRSVLVLLMNIDRYDPMFECCGMGKLGAEAN
ncbi:hypothetical protein ALC60_00913 [Trachymyrmex zeteki]|uniref:Uncharacterized protein n=3 Tax=Attini TaxID=143999 RepID=A0A195CGP3_9HYME|nr:hypothetical protein ALC62_09521 [Cyphomyrmex costatus]KYN20566.1 hypothetical protein ALC57_07055 [Trachymyrmex cornetzi]KYQ60089.1 hypothetical protein ALC60_00913 [Trachymyrmex zeteki]